MSFKLDELYHINSRDRTAISKNASNFIIDFRDPIKAKFPNSKLAVIHAIAPLTYYKVNQTNDTIKVKEGTSDTFTFKLTRGNRTNDEIMDELNDKLNSGTLNSIVYNNTLDSLTGKITFSHVSGTGLSVTYMNTDDYFLADDFLGLNYSTDFVVPNNTPTVGGIINFSGLADSLIVLRLLNMPSSSTYTSESGTYSNILCQIPVNSGYSFDVINYAPLIPEQSDLNIPLQSLNFSITDTRGLEIDFNGKNIQFDLALIH